MTRIPIRFDPWYAPVASALRVGPRDSYLELHDDAVAVHMGWGFDARFPRSAIRAVTAGLQAPWSRGVHGFWGRWLVNGSGDRIVALELEPPQRARVLGVPVRLRQLKVSVDDPDAVAARLQPDTI